MPRAPRIWFPGAWYHVIARGNNKQAVFFTERDYVKYLHLLNDAVTNYDAKVHAYALMPNHVHLMVETGETRPISKLMQWLHTAYTTYVNMKYRRVGHLFQGRYKSLLIDKDAYALELSRYIHLNPVRAHLVTEPAHYRWTSYRAYLDLRSKRSPDSFVITHWVLGLVSPRQADQIALYRDFMEGSDPNRKSGATFVLGV